ncbi:hypothetical protein EST38_g10862 [Candolleomyces aberdarensis]|uniref:Uncharacterized protein n=1 Tax=Candolleomyces aberdarensis TaxID=2316362 RepID=A0A4Q2D8L6_9AGAR|nr:hypothetical protein EST38_g10862 [Candolleomyces aberdarensis]
MRLYAGVVAILIESALPLTVFGIIAAILMGILDASTSRPSEELLVCYHLFFGLFLSFCNLAPHMIIFRVTTGRSFVKFPSAENGVISHPLKFAHRTAESSFLQSSFSRDFGRNASSDVERLGGEESDKAQISPTTQTSQAASQIFEENRNEEGVEKK